MALKNLPGPDPLQRLGRPGEILLVVDHAPDGSPITAGQKVIDGARLGLDHRASADSAGIDPSAMHKWRVKGGRLRALQAQGRRKLTQEELIYVGFVNDLESAEAEFERGCLALIHRVGEGGVESRKTTEVWKQDRETGEMVLVERTVVTEVTPPQWTAKAWLLERRMREKYARRTYSELTGANGTPLIPVEDQARTLADEARAYLAGTDDAQKQAKGAKA